MKIKSGKIFTLCLTDRGEVYSWEYNNYGQLGIGTIDNPVVYVTSIRTVINACVFTYSGDKLINIKHASHTKLLKKKLIIIVAIIKV